MKHDGMKREVNSPPKRSRDNTKHLKSGGCALGKLPRLRFPEFQGAGDWEEKTLKKVFSILQGFAFSSKDSVTNGIRWLKIADVSIQKMNHSTESYLPVEHKEKYKKFTVKLGDYVIALTRPILSTQLKMAPVDKIYHGALLNQRVGKLVTSQDIVFVYFLLQTSKVINNIEKSISGSEPPNLSAQQIEDIATYIPSPKEQQKIANCLASLDQLITAYAQKFDTLKAHKKGLMQQLFPAEGKTVPNTRFPEFQDAGDWKKRKLEEVASFSKGKGISKSDIAIDGKQACIRYGELYTLYNETIENVNSYTNISSKNLVLSKANDVIIPASGETQEDIATASCVMKDGIALGGDLNIIRSQMNGVYLSYYLNSAKKYSIAQMSQGISVVHLYSSQLKNLNINIPDSLEQQKIANFLTSLDQLITTQAEKIEQLKAHKKGLMQQLFPSTEAVASPTLQKVF